jgi:hypothetical protein
MMPPMHTTLRLVDLEALRHDLDEKARAYRSAEPFPHIVLDDVLAPDAFAAVVQDFPAMDDELWKGYLHVNETKYSNTRTDLWAESLRATAEELCSEPFVRFLEELTGIEGLMADWSMDGGGLHQTLRGGHLNIHADFTTHHEHQDWARRVNILLYLNEEWPTEWGGQLELWDKEMTACRARVTPAGNRMLVFTTSFDSFHGHPDPLTCPPDQARRSLALYYFTREDAPIRRATNYQARPEESRGRRLAIAADRRAVDLYDRMKRRLGISDESVHKLLTRVSRRRGGR